MGKSANKLVSKMLSVTRQDGFVLQSRDWTGNPFYENEFFKLLKGREIQL